MMNNDTQLISDYHLESHHPASFIYLIIRIALKLFVLAFLGSTGLVALYLRRRRALNDPSKLRSVYCVLLLSLISAIFMRVRLPFSFWHYLAYFSIANLL